MGRVFKKTTSSKRVVVEEKQENLVSKKKPKKEEDSEAEPEPEAEGEAQPEGEPQSEEEEDEDVDDEDVSDEEEGDDDGDESGEVKNMDFNFGAYPPLADDRDGIINMLTQTFLRVDIDMMGMAEAIIAKAPHGCVVTQDYEDDQTEEDYMAYQLCTTLPLNEKKDVVPKFIKDIFCYLLNRAKGSASSEIYKNIEEIQKAKDGKTGLFVSERLLNFPANFVPQLFDSIRTEMGGFETKFKNIIYIQKLRISEENGFNKPEEKAGSSNGGAPPNKKSKMGKAEKKRAAAAALANAEIEFDNSEDRALFELKEGKEVHFDFPVHMDVEPGSKFHTIEKDGKKWNPFRRVVIMDDKRFDAFLKKGSEGIII